MKPLSNAELKRRADSLMNDCGMTIDEYHELLDVSPCQKCGYDKQQPNGVCAWCGMMRGRP